MMEAYKEEALELLSELEVSLLSLEESPRDSDTIDRIFRALHTIKGSGAMFGFDEIARFTHELESVFERLRGGRMGVTKPLIDLSLRAKDEIRRMLDGSRGGDAEEITTALRSLTGQEKAPPSIGEERLVVREEEARTYRILLFLDRSIFSRGTNPILLLNELRELGESKVLAHTGSIPDLEEMEPEECYTSWEILLTTRRGINAIRDIFIFVEDECELTIEPLEDEPPRRLGEILVRRGEVSAEELQEALREQKRIGEVLVEKGLVEASSIESALLEQEHIERRKQRQEESSIRVPAERLDTLVNLVGEMVTVQARLSQTAAAIDRGDLLSISEEVERLTAELRDSTMSLRMLPMGSTFTKFKRLVRDLASELKKDIALLTEGAETELDKTVIERLNDPLVHLIRNSIDHGIESPEERELLGKPRQGTIRLSAMHSGANVLIRISDDGAGLDEERILKRALERGVVSSEGGLSKAEIHRLIFLPGFSTAREVTSLSGRGVGMDVVKRGIDSLRGSIEVESTKGAGATITLKLPLTLAIIDGLLVRVGEGFFVLPLSNVRECVELEGSKGSQHLTSIRGKAVPYLRLRDRFSVEGEPPGLEQIVVTESSGGSVGFVVDKVIGEHQTVIKSLGRVYRNVEGVSGATILGDGTVALILDIQKLVHDVEREEEHCIQ